MFESESRPAISTTIVQSPTIVEVKNISALTNAVNRNLQITACYGELSNALTKRTGIVANWCTFATWASKQAGVTIRGEDLKRRLEEELSVEPEIQEILPVLLVHSKKLASGMVQENMQINAIRKLVESSQQRASDAVARGNKKVFEEIGFEFARFIANCTNDEVFKETTINEFCSTLRSGLPPDGQDWLREAFSLYYKAFFETEEKGRDELILHANILIGFHEQTRLQPEIAESLDAANIDPQDVKDYLTDLIVNNTNLKGKIIYFLRWLIGGTRLFKETIERLVNTAEKHIRRVITKNLMTLTFPPDTCLHLGDKLEAAYPTDLKEISNSQLLSLLEQIRTSANADYGAACNDWADLKQRIHYIANLFRCYHETKDLFNDPFTDQQLAIIKTGGVPESRL